MLKLCVCLALVATAFAGYDSKSMDNITLQVVARMWHMGILSSLNAYYSQMSSTGQAVFCMLFWRQLISVRQWQWQTYLTYGVLCVRQNWVYAWKSSMVYLTEEVKFDQTTVEIHWLFNLVRLTSYSKIGDWYLQPIFALLYQFCYELSWQLPSLQFNHD